MNYRTGIISIILVIILLVPAGMVKGEKLAIEKVKLIPGLVKEVGGVEDLEINASGPIEIEYEENGTWYGEVSYDLSVWREEGQINRSEGEKFWVHRGDGYYIGGMRVTGEKIEEGEKRGAYWAVSTGDMVYWYDGAMKSERISGKVAVGDSFYVVYEENGELKLKNLENGSEEEIGKAERIRDSE